MTITVNAVSFCERYMDWIVKTDKGTMLIIMLNVKHYVYETKETKKTTRNVRN